VIVRGPQASVGLAIAATLLGACSGATGFNGPRPGPTEAAESTIAGGTSAGTGLSLFVEPQATMAPVYRFLASARRSVEMTMYELSDPEAEQILVADEHRGVRVRVLLDSGSSGGYVNQDAFRTLSAGGVQVAWGNDTTIFHQKTITVDATASMIMTANLTPQYYATTRDFVVVDSQIDDVRAIESVFGSDWTGAPPATEPTGADLVWSPGAAPALTAFISSAKRSVVVENEEMDSVPIEDALRADALRGVRVTIVMTADPSWAFALSKLESAGARVVLYPDDPDALYIHAKVIEVDATRAFVGSQNFSTSSLLYNRELGLITSDRAVIVPLDRVLAGDVSGNATP